MQTPFSPYWIALSAESTVAADQVLAGGAALGELDPVSIGSFYKAFFALSIGYERMAKIAIQVDSRLVTGSFLASKEMKIVGHKLSNLFDRVEEIADRRGYAKLANGVRPDQPIHKELGDLLTGFATTGRYDHLDALGGHGWAGDTAENRWDNSVLPLLTAKHLTPRLRRSIDASRDRFESFTVEARASGFAASFLQQDINGKMRTGIGDIAERSLVYEKMNPWGRMYALQIGRWLARVLGELSTDAIPTGDVPYLSEFFGWLLSNDELLRTRKDLSR